jgi:hypothetical protein
MTTSRSSVSARSSARALGLLLGLVLLLAAAPAWAKKRVVVLGFSGPKAGQAQGAVTAAIKKKHTVVSAGQYTKAKKRLKVKKLNEKGHAKIAADLGVDAIVTGKVARKGTKWSLVVVVREGKSGKVKGTATIPLRGPKIDAKAKQAVAAKVLPLVNKTRPVSGAPADEEELEDEGGDEVAMNDDEDAPDEQDEEEAPPPKKKGKKVAKAAPPPVEPVDDEESPPPDTSEDDEPVPGVDDEVARGGEAGDDDDPDSAVVKKGGGDDDVTSAIAGGKYARHAGFDGVAGGSIVTRSLTFTYRDSLPPQQQPAGYSGSPVPGAFVAAELYPLAFGNPKSTLAGLGLSFDLDRVLILKTRYTDRAGMAYEFGGAQMRWGVGVRYRLPIGDKPTLPTITAGVGYNKLSFDIGSGAVDTGVPNVDYSYVDPRIGVRFPLGSPRLALNVDAAYLIVLSSGVFQDAANYGDGTVAGLDIDAGLEFRPIPRLPIRLGVRYQRMAFSFVGNGAKSNALDMDPTSKDVGGALDLYVGGYLTTGYLF